jgi:murein DD-endopeptidase MepM/ murein hydrolase activator NlpD
VNLKREPKSSVEPRTSSRPRGHWDASALGRYGLAKGRFRSGGDLLSGIGKWSKRLFPERQILVTSRGRVRHLKLSRWFQATLAAAGIAVIAFIAYAMGIGLVIIDRSGAYRNAAAVPADPALLARIEELERKLAAAGTAHAAKPADGTAASSAAVDEAQARINALEEARDRAVAERKELQRQLDSAQQAADAKSQNLSQLNRAIDANRGELRQADSQRAALQGRVNQLESEVDAANARNTQFKATLDTVERKLQQMTVERERMLAERDQLQARLSELQSRPNGIASAPPASEAPRAAEHPSDQHSENSGELEQLIASTGIDVEELLSRLGGAVPANEGGPYVALDQAAAPPDAQRAEELQKIVATLPLGAPLDGFEIESPFGGRADPFTRREAFHPGLDLVAPYRSPVYSTAPGTVTFTGTKSAYGKLVEIDHGHGIVTRYGHLHRITVTRGQKVPAHFQVGELGSTGRSTGPHLHYEVAVNGQVQDPEKFLQAGRNVVQAIGRN